MNGARIAFLTICAFAAMARPCFPQNLTIYCEENAPMQTMGADGKPKGYAIEIVREAQRRIGNSDPIQMVPWARGYEEIKKKPNVALFSMGRTAEREELFSWVGPLFETNYAFYSRADSGPAASTLEEAKKAKTIGVILNDVRDLYLTKAGFTNLLRVSDYATLYRMLKAGRLDLAVGSLVNIGAQLEQAGVSPSEVRQRGIFLKAQLFVAFSKTTTPSVLEEWTKAMAVMKQDGSFERIFKRHFPDMPLPGPAATF